MEIKTFHGGVHPAEHKELSKESPLTQLLPKGELVYMTNQHIGKPASPVVKKGDRVRLLQRPAASCPPTSSAPCPAR